MAQASDIVTVNITPTSVGVTRAGFGVPLILGTPSWANDRVRSYKNITAVGVDFTTDRPEYKAAAALFSQSPRPPVIMIGKLVNKPVQRRTITPTVQNSTDYTIRVGANTVTYTSDSTATAAEIVAGLIALINALTGDTLTASGSGTLVLTADAAGDWDDVQVADPTLLSLVQDHADPGVTADLNAIFQANATWYTIINPWNSAAMATAIAAWAESNARTFIADLQDGPVATTAPAGATDEAATLKTAAYKNTMVVYHPSNGVMAAAGWAGTRLPYTPGSENWAFASAAGVPASTLTETQRSNVLGKNANTYEATSGVNIFYQGKTCSGDWFDSIRGRHWLIARIQEDVYGALASNPKIAYTSTGIALLADKLENVLREAKSNGFLATYDVEIPAVSDISSTDKQNRTLSGLNFVAVEAGAINGAIINGSVSL